MLPVISLVKPVIAAIAPTFLRNLFGGEKSEEFAKKVLDFINEKVSPVDPNADQTMANAEVERAIGKLQSDPELTQRMLEMMLESERQINEKEIEDLKDARQFRKDYGDEVQSNKLINISTGLLVFIIVVILLMLVVTPFLITKEADSPTKELIIQLSGAAFGFLTGIGGMFARNIGSAFDFWFGSSRGSKEKSGQISTVLKNVQSSPQGGGASPDNHAGATPEPTDSIAKFHEKFRQAMASA